MSERLETLMKARERMTDDRDAFAKVLAAPFDRDKAERARVKFIETQTLIDAIDRAIEGEHVRPAAPSRAQAFTKRSNPPYIAWRQTAAFRDLPCLQVPCFARNDKGPPHRRGSGPGGSCLERRCVTPPWEC